jgi:HK97 family phage portal protein
MRAFGLDISRAQQSEIVDTTNPGEVLSIYDKSLPAQGPLPTLTTVDSRGGWWPYVREAFAGAWQRNIETPLVDVMAYSTVFACVTLIATDISKMALRLVQEDSNGIWNAAYSPSFSPVLLKPNRFQTRIQFVMQWILSKLMFGNTYVLKERDGKNNVIALYVLDPQRVTPLVAPDGSVYYQLAQDHLSGLLQTQVTVPAKEIIHDIMYPLYHPLVGMGPIMACGLSAMVGLKIQGNSVNLFANGSNPGGVLTAPGAIKQETADRLKAYWDTNFTGANVGKVAILGDGLKFEPMVIRAVDAQLIEQLKWTSESVCSAFHVPPYLVGVGPMPSYNNIQALSVQYYSQCIQGLVESFELLLDEGLVLPDKYGVEFDLDALLRMDSASMIDYLSKGVGAALISPNEGRKKLNYAPVKGGATPYLQQQNYSLAALAKRDENEPAAGGSAPGSANTPPGTGTPPSSSTEPDDDDEEFDEEKFAAVLFTKMSGAFDDASV